MRSRTHGSRTQHLVSMALAVIGLFGSTACSTEVSDRPEPKTTGITQPLTRDSPVICAKLGEFEARYAAVFLIDRTGSFFTNSETLGHIKGEALRYISALPPGSAVYISYISDASARPEELVIKDAIPPSDEHDTACQVDNVFDRSQRRHCAAIQKQQDAREACVQAAHHRIEQGIIRDLQPATAPATDMTGALRMASETLAAYGTAEHALVMFTDAVDTKGHPLPAQLAGLGNTRVVIRPPLGQSDARPLQAYQTALSGWGATVSIIPLSVTVTAELFPKSPSTKIPSDRAAVELVHR